MKLNASDIDIINHLGYPKVVNLSTGDFLVKKAFKNYHYNELIGEKLSHVFDLFTPHNHVVKVAGDYYVLSEDLNKLGDFKTASQLGMPGRAYSLTDAWIFIETNFPKKRISKLLLDLVRIYIFDVLFYHFDRNLNNWGIITTEKENRLVILDNEFILVSEKDIKESFYYFDKEELELYATLPKYNPLSFIDFNLPEEKQNELLAELLATELEPNIYRDFKVFLASSSKEYQDLFAYYFNLITPEYLVNLIAEVETENNIKITYKEKLIEIYKKNRQNLASIYASVIKEKNHGR